MKYSWNGRFWCNRAKRHFSSLWGLVFMFHKFGDKSRLVRLGPFSFAWNL